MLFRAVYVDVGAPEQEEPLLNAWRDGTVGTEPSETVWHAMPHVRPMPPELQLESSYNIALGDDTPQVIRKYTFAVE